MVVLLGLALGRSYAKWEGSNICVEIVHLQPCANGKVVAYASDWPWVVLMQNGKVVAFSFYNNLYA